MISYSDHVLATKPWAYYPLNDNSLTMHNENHLMMDVSGQKRHITVSNSVEMAYILPINTFNDSIEIRGIKAVNQPAASMSMNRLTESGAALWLSSGVPINDVSNENPYVSHALWHNKLRFEWIMSVPKSVGGSPYPCGIYYYPIVNFGGVSLWMSTIWFSPCENCACLEGGSALVLAVNIQRQCHPLLNPSAISTSLQCKIIYVFPYLIDYEGQSVQTGITSSTGHLYESLGTGMLKKNRRYIFEYEYINNKHIRFSYIFDGDNTPISLHSQDRYLNDYYADYLGQCSEEFLYPYDWTDVAYYGGAAISNLSIHRGTEIPIEYDHTVKTWNALTNVFVPSQSSDIIQLTDNIDTSRILDTNPNSVISQLDSLLIRGCSHRLFTTLTVENTDDTSEVTLWLLPASNSKMRLEIHDFFVGDMISLDGCSQSILNKTWQVTARSQDSVSFVLEGTVHSEGGLFMIKRPPIGGGAWIKTFVSNGAIYKSSSNLGSELMINDTAKTGTSLVIMSQNASQPVFLKRNLKRSSSHYQPDTRQSRPEWTCIGDDKRFYLAIAYKQNPKDHTHLIVFGIIKDWTTDEWKTMLIGYKDESIGNVGFNALFAYSHWSILDSGHLLCQTKSTEANSDAVWVRSEHDGFTYLRGTADCGQRMYPIPIPHTPI